MYLQWHSQRPSYTLDWARGSVSKKCIVRDISENGNIHHFADTSFTIFYLTLALGSLIFSETLPLSIFYVNVIMIKIQDSFRSVFPIL